MTVLVAEAGFEPAKLRFSGLTSFRCSTLPYAPCGASPLCQQARKVYASYWTMERRAGLEPARPAWKAGMLPTTSAARIPAPRLQDG